jgi:hypothetical protein
MGKQFNIEGEQDFIVQKETLSRKLSLKIRIKAPKKLPIDCDFFSTYKRRYLDFETEVFEIKLHDFIIQLESFRKDISLKIIVKDELIATVNCDFLSIYEKASYDFEKGIMKIKLKNGDRIVQYASILQNKEMVLRKVTLVDNLIPTPQSVKYGKNWSTLFKNVRRQ